MRGDIHSSWTPSTVNMYHRCCNVSTPTRGENVLHVAKWCSTDTITPVVRKSTKHTLSRESITKSHTKLNKWPFLKTIDKTSKNWRKKGQLAIYWLGLWKGLFFTQRHEPSTFIWLSALWQNEFVKWLTNTYTGWDNLERRENFVRNLSIVSMEDIGLWIFF